MSEQCDCNCVQLVDGKIPTKYLPALALTNVTTVADTTARDALTGTDEGDVAIVRDSGGGVRATYLYDGTEWQLMSSPADVTEAELAAAVAFSHALLGGRIAALEHKTKYMEQD